MITGFVLSIFSKVSASINLCAAKIFFEAFSLIHPPHLFSTCLILLPCHSERLLNDILTPVINNRPVIPLSVNIPPAFCWGLENFQSPQGLIYSLLQSLSWLIPSSPLSLFTKSVLCQLLLLPYFVCPLIWESLPFYFFWSAWCIPQKPISFPSVSLQRE